MGVALLDVAAARASKQDGPRRVKRTGKRAAVDAVAHADAVARHAGGRDQGGNLADQRAIEHVVGVEGQHPGLVHAAAGQAMVALGIEPIEGAHVQPDVGVARGDGARRVRAAAVEHHHGRERRQRVERAGEVCFLVEGQHQDADPVEEAQRRAPGRAAAIAS